MSIKAPHLSPAIVFVLLCLFIDDHLTVILLFMADLQLCPLQTHYLKGHSVILASYYVHNIYGN